METDFNGLESMMGDNEYKKRKEERLLEEDRVGNNIVEHLIDDLDECLDPVEDYDDFIDRGNR